VTTDRHQPSREELAVCAHDLRGALTIIAGYVDMLRRHELDAAQREKALAGIDAAVMRADRLLGETLSGTRPEATRTGERFDLVALTMRAAADARAAYGREVAPRADAERVQVAGDEDAMARALQNLLGNAAKYAPEGPLEVRVAVEGDRAVVEVADRGPGIPVEQREDVFEPFARLERDVALEGTGLGLTVVRSVAERMGGRAMILGREGGGAVVRLELPLG